MDLKKSPFFILLLLVLSFSEALAQDSYKKKNRLICGQVKELYTNRLLPNTEIYLPFSKRSFRSDASGRFDFTIERSKRRSAVKRPGKNMKSKNFFYFYQDSIMIVKHNFDTDTISISDHMDYYEIYLEDQSAGTGGLMDTNMRVADMHYHISMKGYNENALYLHDQLERNDLDSNLVWQKRFHKLESKYDNKWVRPKSTNDKLYYYTQATLPHVKEGGVKLAFNAISPFEHNLADDKWIRLFSNLFKSNAKFPWLRRIGSHGTGRLTHWESFNLEYDFVTNQSTDYNGFKWDFLRSGLQLENDSVTPYVVNVIEGAHALQDIYFPHEQFKSEAAFYKYIVDQYNAADSLINNELNIQSEKYTGKERSRLERNLKKHVGELEQSEKFVNRILTTELKKNIGSLKSLDPPIFMMTVGHLSYNNMLDHAPALDANGIGKVFIKRTYRIKVSDYREFVKQWKDLFFTVPGVNPLGKTLIRELLSNKNGHRIFIDLKHSAYSTRKFFYDSVLTAKNPPPPICSHCGANGLSELYHSPLVDEYALLDSKAIQHLYPFAINLFDEEIGRICQNDGIIGITLEQRVLGSYINAKKRARAQKESLEGMLASQNPDVKAAYESITQTIVADPEEAFEVLCQDYNSLEPFMQNLFRILDHSTVDLANAWNHVCIGSDLDGIIDPIDICPTASQYPYMQKRLKELIPVFLELRLQQDESAYQYKDYFKRIDIDDALDKLFYRSLRDFVKDNFRP